jgi:adenylate cyclase
VGSLSGDANASAASARPAGAGRSRLALAALAIALLLLALGHWLAGDALRALQERAGDFAWRIAADRTDERRLIVVDVDERSLREVGPWPWPRATQAELIERLAEAGAALQVLDLVLPERRDGDDRLAAAIARHRPVLAQVFALEQGATVSTGRPVGALAWPACPKPFGDAAAVLANDAGLVAADGLHAGHITPRLAADGVLRHQPAVVCYEGRAYPALALAALLQGTGDATVSLERGGGLLDAPWRLVVPALPGGAIPLDARGDVRLPWRRHPQSFVSVSAADVLAGRVPPDLLRQAWVLVGGSAFGLNDIIATPFGGASAGLLAHAQLITALVDARVPATPRAAAALQAAAALAGVLLLLAFERFGRGRHGGAGVLLLPVAALLLAGGLWALHAWLLASASLWIGWLHAALFLLLFAAAYGALGQLASRRDRDRLYAHLASYLPAPVAASLALQPPSSAIRANTQQVSVLVADIRNFSAYCEARPPEESAAVLHAFFSAAARIVEAQGGVVEAFQGDAVVAVWNSGPAGPAGDHAPRALRAAERLLEASHGLLPDPAPAHLEPLALGIGLETGPAMVGSFGIASRRAHMVMGRTVTIASRLAAMTADLSHPILLGEGMAAQLAGVEGGAPIESLGTFLLDGLRMPHHVYAVPVASEPRVS